MALISVQWAIAEFIIDITAMYYLSATAYPHLDKLIRWITRTDKIMQMKEEHATVLRELRGELQRMHGCEAELGAELKTLCTENERLKSELEYANHISAIVYSALTVPRIPIADQVHAICSFTCTNTHQPVLAVLRDATYIDITTVDANQGYVRSSCIDCVTSCQRELRAKGYTQQFAMGDVWVPEGYRPVHELAGEALAFRVCPHLNSTMYVVWDGRAETIEICSYDPEHGWRRSVCVDCVVSGQRSVREMGIEQRFGVGDIWMDHEPPVQQQQEEEEEFDEEEEDEGVADVDDEEDEEEEELPRIVDHRVAEPRAAQPIVAQPELPEEVDVRDGVNGGAPRAAEEQLEYAVL